MNASDENLIHHKVGELDIQKMTADDYDESYRAKTGYAIGEDERDRKDDDQRYGVIRHKS